MSKRSTFAFICFCGAVIPAGIGISDLNAQTSPDKAWQTQTTSRLRAIYERGEFRGKRFQAEWLPDSSGYIVREREPETNQPMLVQYDVLTGKRTESTPANEGESNSKRRLSPDGKRVVEFRGRNLIVRDLATGQRTQLTEHADERDIRYREPVWSPDSKRIAFIESMKPM
jgi:dipeptidyl-peptidase-4